MSKLKAYAGLFLLLFCWVNQGEAKTREHEKCSNTTSSGSYQQQYSTDEFVIFYDVVGDHSISNQTDSNHNQVPDIVEDVMLQLITMRDVLRSLGFKHPFDQHRYERAGVGRIHVGMRNTDIKGLAFDPPHRDTTPGLGEPCVLLIRLSPNLETGDLTPAHELFHLYQYGYTVYKNSWYLEGIARWAESLLGERAYPRGVIPNTPEEKEALFSQSYNAVSFWMAFLKSVSPSTVGEQNYPDGLRARRYVDGGQIIHKKASTHGAAAIINVLESFDMLDRLISNDKGLGPKSWPNTDRHDVANNEPMFNVVYQLIDD
ncbi:hypothetical protein ACT3TC_03155 [Halomonas sp. AOP27-A1-41]|uniref:hypothetical protein n=1 Tax=Halomonas sp. AOP27-A1-41 TaxID=3457707 RepID=UPI0040344EC7